MDNDLCSFAGCPKDAEFEVYDSEACGPNFTLAERYPNAKPVLACGDHVGDLLEHNKRTSREHQRWIVSPV